MAYLDRMSESLYPVVDTVVMIKVKSINNEGAASVSLLDFNNIDGTIPDPNCDTIVWRIEPVMVSSVVVLDDERRVITLSRSGVSLEDRMACEVRYVERKLVQTILRKLSLTLRTPDLLGLDSRLTDSTTHQTLTSSDFLNSLPENVRVALVASIEAIKYESLRRNIPFVVFPSPLIERNGFCWVVALIRQLEAMLKLAKQLPIDEHLSMQDLINQMPPAIFDVDEGDIESLDLAAEILATSGVVLESQCPTKFTMPNGLSAPGTKYKARLAEVVDCDTPPEKDSGITHMKSLLKTGPISGTVVWFESYKKNNPDGSGIYKPTKEEWEEYLADPYACDIPSHTMLLSGSGVDEHGVHYWEFQDCLGDVNNGDRGFIQFVLYPGLIIEFVEMEV